MPKHKGLTFFFLDMKAPGVEVRPIKQISGGANFNEVFFTDVRIPDSQRLGAVGEAGRCRITTLMNERLGGGRRAGRPTSRDLLALAPTRRARRTSRRSKSSAVRARLADWYVEARGPEATPS